MNRNKCIHNVPYNEPCEACSYFDSTTERATQNSLGGEQASDDEVVADEQNNFDVFGNPKPLKTSGFTYYDSSKGHCGLCGKKDCKGYGYCFK